MENKNAEGFYCKAFSNDSKYLYYQCKIKNGRVENHILELGNMMDRLIPNQPEFPLLVGGSEGLILDDKYLLASLGIAKFDSNDSDINILGKIGLAKLNFDINSMQEPEIQYREHYTQIPPQSISPWKFPLLKRGG